MTRVRAHKFAVVCCGIEARPLIALVLPQCISELPNSDPEIRSIRNYKSTLVEEVTLIFIVKTLGTASLASFRVRGAEWMPLVTVAPSAGGFETVSMGRLWTSAQWHQQTSDSGHRGLPMSIETPNDFGNTTRVRRALRRDAHRAAESRRSPARADQQENKKMRRPKQRRPKERIRKTDLGTILLHWILVVALTLAVGTGLRIAMDSPEHAWLVMFDSILPLYKVWTLHIPAALVLIAVSVAYAAYVLRGGLMRRIRLDWMRLSGLFNRSHQVRWGSINIVLYWVLFVTMIMEIATGTLLWLGYGSDLCVEMHMWGTWIILAYTAAHITAHFALGGINQLARVFRPTKLGPPQKPFDPMEMVADLLDPESAAKSQAERQGQSGGRRIFRLSPLVVAAVAATAGIAIAMTVDHESEDTYYVKRIAKADRPLLDGDMSDGVWRNVKPFTMFTELGGNYDGKGEAAVQIRAVHDGEWAYFCFMWDDPTRSLKHLPLVKRIDGWHVLHDRYDRGDERSYYEDKFSALFTMLPIVIPGDRTYHAGPTPIAGKPTTLSHRGLHFTPKPGLAVEVWQWKASSGGLLGWVDKNHFDVPKEPTEAQEEGQVPYRGGFIQDPRTAQLYSDNFDRQPLGGYEQPILPKRLPKNWKATYEALGRIDTDPNHSDAETSRWWMNMEESEPYSAKRDAEIPVGTMIPGSLILVDDIGQRADVTGMARWAAGHWTLEVARKLAAKAPDVPITSGTYMRVAVFDHAQIYHTRHVRPIRLELQR
jgi:cytochrome b subunit of formate dehydrogenase